MDTYKILIRTGVPSSSSRPQLWRFHTVTGGEHWQTNDVAELEDEVRNLLQENPIPIISIIKSINFDIAVEIE